MVTIYKEGRRKLLEVMNMFIMKTGVMVYKIYIYLQTQKSSMCLQYISIALCKSKKYVYVHIYIHTDIYMYRFNPWIWKLSQRRK